MHTPKIKQRKDIKSQTSPITEASPQLSGSDTESFLAKQTRNTRVQCHNDSMKQNFEIRRKETDMTDNDSGDDISPPK